MSYEKWKLAACCRIRQQGVCAPSPHETWSLTDWKALAKNENNYKAMFRKGKALGEQGFFEKAVKILEDLKKKNPSGTHTQSFTRPQLDLTFYADAAVVDQEVARLRAIDDERERAHRKKLKGMLHLVAVYFVPNLAKVSSPRT